MAGASDDERYHPDSMNAIMWRRLELLEKSVSRFEILELSVKDLKSDLNDMQNDQRATRELVWTFRSSVEKLTESIDKIKSVDLALQNIKEKMINYDNKFQSFDDLKKLVIAGICATIPGTLNGLIEMAKYMLSHKTF